MSCRGAVLVVVSYDFAIIPVDNFTTADEARRLCDLLYDEPQGDRRPRSRS
jgi:hypothetical protein